LNLQEQLVPVSGPSDWE